MSDFPPKILYKYYDFETAKKIILKNQLKLTQPKDFNDPFDCYDELIDFSNLTESNIKAIISKSDNVTEIEKEKKLQEIKKDPNILIDAMKFGLNQQKGKIGIACFSKDCDNILMWSHYANKHTGICVGYELTPHTDNYIIQKVKYPKLFKKISYYNNSFECLTNWITQKAKDWKYEKEYRMISFDYHGYVNIDRKSIKEIYLGSECENKQELVNSIFKMKYDTKVYKMVLDKNNFKLNPEIINNRKNVYSEKKN